MLLNSTHFYTNDVGIDPNSQFLLMTNLSGNYIKYFNQRLIHVSTSVVFVCNHKKYAEPRIS